MPGSGSLEVLACSEAAAWIGTGRSMERYLAGQPDALLVRVGRDGTFTAMEVPGTFVSTFQPTASGGGSLLAIDVSDLVLRSRLLVRRDQHEETVAVPPATFGAAFHTPSEGYVWGGRAVHRTTDGGRTWVRNRIDSGEILRSPATMPQLSSDGELWVPVQGSGGGVLMAIRNDEASRTVAEWKGEQVSSVRLSQDGTPYVVLMPQAGYGFRVLVIPAAGGVSREVYRSPTGSVAGFTVSGSRLALLVVGGVPPSSYFGAWPTALHTSVDGGKTWEVRDTTSARVRSICGTPTGIWATSTPDRTMNFIRW